MMIDEKAESPLEIWGGHECTINRIGDRFQDQSERTGHLGRFDDLDRFKSLGITRLRYPVLWEAVSFSKRDGWRRSDVALKRLRELEISPIVGLLHHGSGPKWTDLLADDFASGLARHAARVVERYPWVWDWTPVNEPLTTARFSALYGHWYPHARDERLFWLALLNQVDAIRLSMAEIRRLNPSARLIQTEDLGRTDATADLQHQAEFDNERRWATWDLLEGRFTPGHALYDRLCTYGFRDRLSAIADAPCPADINGINHYLTSDRFLDEALECHPPETHGGNGVERYADIASVRVAGCVSRGLPHAIEEAFARYRKPLALTEIHNGCTREEQMRWLADAWSAATDARNRDIPVVALTAWSLMGACDWTSLLTVERGEYESGVWDIRSSPPRETALAPLVRSLAKGAAHHHPVLANSGWWVRPSDTGPALSAASSARSRPLLITGATGTLGQAIAGACRLRKIPYRLTTRHELPLDDMTAAAQILDEIKPWAVINCAGWVRVDEAEHHRAQCMAANVEGALDLARQCAVRDIPYTLFSSDLVFGGELGRSYVESDVPAPINVYGTSKAEADTALLNSGMPVLIIRTAAFFSAHDRHNFAMHVVQALREKRIFKAASDVVVTPTFVPDLVRATLDLVIDGERGLWHITHEDPQTWHDFARTVATATGTPLRGLASVTAEEMGWIAPRPKSAALGSERGRLLAPLDRAIGQFARDLAWHA
jgi:dTDP-4-dehydrorhamnose reductase